MATILSASWVGAHFYYKPQADPQSEQYQAEVDAQRIVQNDDFDREVDRALQYSLEGKYYEAANILIPLAQKGFSRAQLYLAVAYYHGHGVDRDHKKAAEIFFTLQKKQYEPGIVGTYLNLLGSLAPG